MKTWIIAVLCLGATILPSSRVKAQQWKLLHSFSGAEAGCHPSGGLIQFGDLLCGATRDGGLYGRGTLYCLSSEGKMIYRHEVEGTQTSDGREGGRPRTELTAVSSTTLAGILYDPLAVNSSDLSFIFWRPASGEKVIAPINKRTTSIVPAILPLTAGSDGRLYGMGLLEEKVVLFSTIPGEPLQKEGELPLSPDERAFSLLNGREGNLYGLYQHGSKGSGGIFQFSPATRELSILIDFSTVSFLGSTPANDLALDREGYLYGVTGTGEKREGEDASGAGVFYKVDSLDGSSEALQSFSSELERPQSGLVRWGEQQWVGAVGNMLKEYSVEGTTATIATLEWEDAWFEGTLLSSAEGSIVGTFEREKGCGGVFQLTRPQEKVVALATTTPSATGTPTPGVTITPTPTVSSTTATPSGTTTPTPSETTGATPTVSATTSPQATPVLPALSGKCIPRHVSVGKKIKCTTKISGDTAYSAVKARFGKKYVKTFVKRKSGYRLFWEVKNLQKGEQSVEVLLTDESGATGAAPLTTLYMKKISVKKIRASNRPSR